MLTQIVLFLELIKIFFKRTRINKNKIKLINAGMNK